MELLLNKLAKHFQQKDFEKALSKISNFKEKEKYRNWYKGITKVPIKIDWGGLLIESSISTFAQSGQISNNR